MKVALLGAGKTGGKVKELLGNNQPTVFDINNPPNLENLKGHDVIISFLPGEAFASYIPLLLKSQIPVVTGSTGVIWPAEINKTIIECNCRWVWSANYSLGMRLIHPMIEILSQTPHLFRECQAHIHEIHHTKKLDAPSGTALVWKKWLGMENARVTSERVGDVVGIHELKIETENEIITLRHEAKDRRIFAQGALWAAERLLSDKNLGPGLHSFEKMVAQFCSEVANEC